MQIIIPMSGMGKRFVEAGYSDPKPLIKIDDYPIIKHVIDLFPNETNFLFVCNEKHLRENNIDKILRELVPKCKIFSVAEGSKRGPVEAVMSIADQIDENEEVIVSYCDYGTLWNYEEFLYQARKNNFDGSIACYRGFHPHMLGNDHYAYVKNVDNIALGVSEKTPFTDNKMNEYASNGTYYFSSGSLVKKYFQMLIDSDNKINNEFYVSVVYNFMIKDGLEVGIFEIEKMLQWGTPYDLECYRNWSDYFKNIIKSQPKISCPKDTTLILPMAGKGSRFSEDGYETPKPLLDINGLPMVIQAVNCLPKCEKNVFICLKEHDDDYDIKKNLESNYENVSVSLIEKTTMGQACTCEIGLMKNNIDLEKPILISACDNGVYYDSKECLELMNDEDVDVIVWSFRNNQTSKINPNMYSWLEVDKNNFIQHVSCKNFKYNDPLKTHAIIGTMFFRKAKYFLEGLKLNYSENIRTNNEFYVDDVINQNIKNNLKVKVFEVKNYICWGTPNDHKTYLYWRDFFHLCDWHPYRIDKDITYSLNQLQS
jgi:NDP-sugar pyrophosphorylase family protein